jgi:hypothetical protein
MMGLMVALFGVLAMVIVISNRYAAPEEQFTTTGAIIFSSIMFLSFVSAVFAFRIRFTVTEVGAEISWGPFGIPRRKISWDKVVSVEEILVNPTEWGGWGYRINPFKKSTAAILRKGPGLKFTFNNNRVFIITLDDAGAALSAVEKAMPHNHSTCGHNHDDWTTYIKED